MATERIVKTTGDGMLAEFASAQDACCGAQSTIDIQTAMAELESANPMDSRIIYAERTADVLR